MIVGNGVLSVSQLIDSKNRSRAKNPHLRSRLIRLDAHRIRLIGQQGYRLNDVVKQGEEVLIDSKAGFATGGDSFDLTDYVHPSFSM